MAKKLKRQYIPFFETIKESILLEYSKSEGWLNIGLIKDASPIGNGGDVYIMVNPNGEGLENPNEFVWRNTALNTEPDGSGIDVSVPSYKMKGIQIYPEYADSPYADLFLPKKKDDEQAKAIHAKFLNDLDIRNGYVYLKHNSSYKITDGVIRSRGSGPKFYSSDSDIGAYFWGSKKIGRDQSNGQQYTYICKVKPEEIYDFNVNPKRYQDVRHAAGKERYVGRQWQDEEDVIAVVSGYETPITMVRDNSNSHWYDANWNLIS